MKTALSFILAVTILTSAYSQHHADPENSQHEVQQMVIHVFDALSNRDAASLRSYCTRDVRFYEYGEAWPLDTLIDLAITKNTAADFKRTNKFDFIRTTIQGDIAWTTYNLHSTVTRNGKNAEVYWMETVVLIREENKWKVSVLHSTRVDKK